MPSPLLFMAAGARAGPDTVAASVFRLRLAGWAEVVSCFHRDSTVFPWI